MVNAHPDQASSYPGSNDGDSAGGNGGGLAAPPTECQPGLLEVPRVLGELGPEHGPRLVVVAGMHGNEPSGVLGFERVYQRLRDDEGVLKGRLLGLAGNLGALSRGERYLDEDLNRMWFERRVERVLAAGVAGNTEEAELAELAVYIDRELTTAPASVCLLDMHSTSGPGPPFTVVDDTLPNRYFAEEFPVPLVLGLEEEVGGTLSHFASIRGARAIGFESGQHYEPVAVERAEAAIWIALEVAGVLERGARPEVAAARRRLAGSPTRLPYAVEVRYRHVIHREGEFRPNPGLVSFQEVEEGQHVAHDSGGPVAAPLDGLLLMPLYQAQGGEGFFVVKKVRRFWLALSALVRRVRLERHLHLLPGVVPHEELPGAFVIDREVARWYSREIFHLLGFRRRRHETEGKMVMVRREHDRPMRHHGN